jgi:hypothetical protein
VLVADLGDGGHDGVVAPPGFPRRDSRWTFFFPEDTSIEPGQKAPRSPEAHLSPNLGVVELTIALHRVFDSPRDKLVFDTGHQSYVHNWTSTAMRDPSNPSDLNPAYASVDNLHL